MSLFDEPRKAKSVYAVTFTLLTLVLVVTAGILGYLCYRSYNDIEQLQSKNSVLIAQVDSLQDEVAEYEEAQETLAEELEGSASSIEECLSNYATCKTNKKKVTDQKDALSEENDALKTQISAYQTRINTINAYNQMHWYIYDVIQAHNGFSGWTQEEYEIGYAKAVATGDQGLIAAVDNAWNNKDGDPITRFQSVMWEIIDGINGQVQ